MFKDLEMQMFYNELITKGLVKKEPRSSSGYELTIKDFKIIVLQ